LIPKDKQPTLCQRDENDSMLVAKLLFDEHAKVITFY
jgi:hypothetical protein